VSISAAGHIVMVLGLLPWALFALEVSNRKQQMAAISGGETV
jgi:hypothetical protein